MRLLPSGTQVVVLLFVSVISGCATPIKPDALATPREITCLALAEPLSVTGQYGMFNVEWTTKLEKGVYLSERVDDKGTYYRAPGGGISTTSPGGAPPPGWHVREDGGFYIPNRATDPVRIYRYFSTAEAPTDAADAASTCSTLAYTKDPSGKKLSVVSVATAGALGGATGGMIGRSIAKGSTLSYGQAAGAGATGGLIAGVVVASFINSDVGKIVPALPIQDTMFMEKLRELAANSVTLKELGSAGDVERTVK